MFRPLLFLFFFLLSLLAIFPAPLGLLWYAAIVVTEFPWIFIFTVIILLCWRFGTGKYETLSMITGLLALLLFAYPVIGAYGISRSLNKELYHAFPIPEPAARPYSFWKMIVPGSADPVPYRTMRYNDSTHFPYTLDYYPSQVGGRRPCVVVIHGGSWAVGDSRQLPELNSYLARTGYQVVSLNYRMAPYYLFPAPIEDVQTALRFLRAHADALQIDTSNFVLLGRSAGAQIALVAGYSLPDQGIKGIVSFYGPTDMKTGYAHPANPLVFDSRKVMENYLGGTPDKLPAMYDSSSATRYVTHESVPTLLIHGKDDPIVNYTNSSGLAHELAQHGVKYFLLTIPWGTHGCDYTLNGPSGQLSTYTVERFIRSVTQQPVIIMPSP